MKQEEKNGIIPLESVLNDIFEFFPLDEETGKPITIDYSIGFKDNKRLPHKVDLLNILYIDLRYKNREEVAVYLSQPIHQDGKIYEMLRWNKRLTGDEILEKLGNGFIRISDRYIVQKYAIISLDKNNCTLTVRERHFAKNIDSYKTKELKCGDTYLPEIDKSGVFNLVELTNVEAPVCDDYYHIGKSRIMINPISIALIEIDGENKRITLEHSFGDESLKPTSFVWKTRWSVKRVFEHLRIDTFIQVHKSYWVSLYVLDRSSELLGGKLKLKLGVKGLMEKTEITIPVSRSYKKELQILLKDVHYSNFEKLIFAACDYDIKKTEKLLSEYNKGRIDFYFYEEGERVPKDLKFLNVTYKGLLYVKKTI